ncbi:IspD/TarI family cytidylyltransferase [Mycobacterium neglectum]|uniref:IspD/TarI family cytidylyltransferase n=1 Tax=Mycobacterium neglectum TaxID=242737 RepID=UPI000BFF0F13|nr:2-C-methyl-D-erythritol 4-phosphate cytidylyltransferase [Mycobacterium neglectum]
MDVSVVVPLPISVVDNTAAAFLPLAAAPPLSRVVRTLLGAVAEPGRIVVAAAEPLIDDVGVALASEDLASIGVAAVDGDATRADCLAAALEYLRHASFSTTHVLVHDISSPLVSTDVVQRVVAGLRGGGTVVLPELAVTDSVKSVNVHGSVTATVDRSVLRTIQFPRGFAMDALAGWLAQRTFGDFDEVAVAIGAATPITFVDGDPDAFRPDLPRDAEFIEAIIASR